MVLEEKHPSYNEKIAAVFLFLQENLCCGHSLKVSHLYAFNVAHSKVFHG